MSSNSPTIAPWRHQSFAVFVVFGFLIVVARLFYWQIIRGPGLLLAAEDQYQSYRENVPSRGKILTADRFTLVDNQTVYRLFAEPPLIDSSPEELADQLSQALVDPIEATATPDLASASAEVQRAAVANLVAQTKIELQDRLSSDKKWVPLDPKITESLKQHIESLQLKGLGFDPYEVRAYPEASMAAHVTGFVGKDEQGQDLGYFGVEGALNQELSGAVVATTTLTDALGLPLLFSASSQDSTAIPGRDITLTIRRDIQFLVETELANAIGKYGAKSGEVIVVEPQTGKILALAAWPKYDQSTFYKFDPSWYKNPSLADTYEPGSTFKTLTVSAGIDTGTIDDQTQCPSCDGPRRISGHTLKTWNDIYNPNITMTDALATSDNTAMIFIAEQLGSETFTKYLLDFGISQALDLDLQEDTPTPFPQKWGPVELATASFGQGIVTNSLQLVRAVAAIANRGQLMQLQVVDSVYDPATQKTIVTQPQPLRQVISPQTAATVTKMMVAAAEHGEAQWTASQQYSVAGKTGTSQVAEGGSYDEDKTIASFIGFAPADNPKFIMLVKLVEPSSSPWAAETAAPLWYRIANRLFLLLAIPPDKV